MVTHLVLFYFLMENWGNGGFFTNPWYFYAFYCSAEHFLLCLLLQPYKYTALGGLYNVPEPVLWQRVKIWFPRKACKSLPGKSPLQTSLNLLHSCTAELASVNNFIVFFYKQFWKKKILGFTAVTYYTSATQRIGLIMLGLKIDNRLICVMTPIVLLLGYRGMLP